jgi:hypothetical protein
MKVLILVSLFVGNSTNVSLSLAHKRIAFTTATTTVEKQESVTFAF